MDRTPARSPARRGPAAVTRVRTHRCGSDSPGRTDHHCPPPRRLEPPPKTVENLHDWRKRAKDLWYHLRLLKPFSPAIIGGHADEAHRLADLLGDDHDLALLRETLLGGGGEVPVDVEAVIGLIEHRRDQLQAEAMQVGERLYAERPKAFRRRMHRYWKATRRGPLVLATS